VVLVMLASVVIVGAASCRPPWGGVDDIPVPPPHGDDVPTIPPPNPPKPPPNDWSPAAQELAREARGDAAARQVVCFAYENFYDDDTGNLSLPSEEEFVGEVVAALAPPGSEPYFRAKAGQLHEIFQSLEAGEARKAATDITCL